MESFSFLRKCAAVCFGVGVLVLGGCEKTGTVSQPAEAPVAVAAASPAPGLKPATANSFAEVTQQLDAGGDLYFYLSTAQVLGKLSHGIDKLHGALLSGSASQTAEQRDEAEKGFALLKDVVQKSGVEEITGVGGSSFPMAPGVYRNRLFVHHYAGKDTGILWRLYGTVGQSDALGRLDLLPADTAVAGYGDFDLASLLGFVRGEAETSGIPEMKQSIEQWETQFAGLTGLKIDDVLQSLNGSMGMVLTLDGTETIPVPGQQQRVPTPRLALLMAVKSDLIFNQVDKMAGGIPTVVKVDEPDLKMRTMEFAPIPGMMFRPTVASWGGYLIVASDDKLVRDMIAVKKGAPGYKATAEYATLSAGLPAQGNGFAMVTQRFEDALRNVENEAMANQRKTNAGVRGTVTQNVFLGGENTGHFLAVYGLLPNGWLSVSQGSHGASQLILPAAIGPAAIAGALFFKGPGAHVAPHFQPGGPNLGAESVGHAKQICLGCVMYASANGGNFPPTLDALFPKYLTDRSVLVSPFEPGVPVGYNYTPGLKLTDPADTVLFEDKFAPGRNLRVVAHVDGKTSLVAAE